MADLTKYTAGPYFATRSAACWEIRGGGRPLAYLPKDRDEVQNAKIFSAAPEAIDFVRKQYESMNCICKGPIGNVQKLMGTDVSCTKCEAEVILKKAGLL